MNIQAQLFKILNVVKYRALEYDKKWQAGIIENARDPESKVDPLDHYYATYYNGAYDAAKILIKCYQGEFSGEEVEYWIGKLDNIGNEVKVS